MGDLFGSDYGLDDYARQLRNLDVDEDEISMVEAIVGSMTPEECAHPEILDDSRRERIAHESGVDRLEVDNLIDRFDRLKQNAQQFASSRGKEELDPLRAALAWRRDRPPGTIIPFPRRDPRPPPPLDFPPPPR